MGYFFFAFKLQKSQKMDQVTLKQLWTVCCLFNSRECLFSIENILFSLTNNYFNLLSCAENKRFLNHGSNVLSQAERLGVCGGGIMWALGRDDVLKRDTMRSPIHPSSFPSIHSSIHCSLPSYLALSLSLSPPRPPTFLTAGPLSCRYLPRDKRIYWHNWSDINLI